MTGDDPFSPLQGRSQSTTSICGCFLQVIDVVMSLALCPQAVVVSQAPHLFDLLIHKPLWLLLCTPVCQLSHFLWLQHVKDSTSTGLFEYYKMQILDSFPCDSVSVGNWFWCFRFFRKPITVASASLICQLKCTNTTNMYQVFWFSLMNITVTQTKCFMVVLAYRYKACNCLLHSNSPCPPPPPFYFFGHDFSLLKHLASLCHWLIHLHAFLLNTLLHVFTVVGACAFCCTSSFLFLYWSCICLCT